MLVARDAKLSCLTEGKVLAVAVSHSQISQSRKKHKLYAVYLCREMNSNGTCGAVSIIYRTHQQFRSLEHAVTKKLKNHKIRLGLNKRLHNIPTVGKASIFGKWDNQDDKIRLLDDYLQFVVRLPTDVMDDPAVKEFFRVSSDDMYRLKRDETIEVYDDGLEISEPVPAEYHVVRETYTKQGPGEIDLQAGEEVEIIKKNDTGWWMAVTSHGTGWIPSAYVHAEQNYHPCRPGNEEYHIVTSSYAKVLDDELSVPEGAVVQVLDRNTSGWWLVKCGGKIGLAPGTNMKRVDTIRAKRAFIILGKTSTRPCMALSQKISDASQSSESSGMSRSLGSTVSLGSTGSGSSGSESESSGSRSDSTGSSPNLPPRNISSGSLASMTTVPSISRSLASFDTVIGEVQLRLQAGRGEGWLQDGVQPRDTMFISDMDMFQLGNPHDFNIAHKDHLDASHKDGDTQKLPGRAIYEATSRAENKHMPRARVIYDQSQAVYDNVAFTRSPLARQNDNRAFVY